MVKLVDKQTSFNFGIITERLRARDDLKQYPSGVADAFNFYASKYGPISKRVGTLFKFDAGNVGQKVNLVPFVLSLSRSLVLEFLDKKIRFYTFDGENFGAIADPTNTSKAYEITSPYTAAQVEHLSFAQSLNVIYIADPNGNAAPKELRRNADNDWYFADYTTEDGPYLDPNYNSNKTITVNRYVAMGGRTHFELSGWTLSQSDVGRHIRVNCPDKDTLEDVWGWGKITSVASDGKSGSITFQQLPWDKDKEITEDDDDWEDYEKNENGIILLKTSDYRLGAWYGTNWPSLVTIHEQRLVWQGTTNYPWLWMSNSFNYYNFSPSDYEGNVKDTNAICYNMATDKIAPVRWLASLGSLIIGTEMYEMRMYSAGAGLAPGDCVVRKESTYGVHNALPVITDDTLIFIQRLQRTLRSAAYDYTRDAYVGPELSVLSESLTVPGMKKIILQREPNSIIWALLEDGTLLAVTYDKEQDVTAWTRCEIAGKNAKVIDIVSLPSVSFKQDMLIMLVERTINGSTKRYMEIMSKEYLKDTPLKDIPFLDSAMRYKGSKTTKITGLTHLEGETVRVLDEGALREDVVVKNGTIELQYAMADGWIGLPYKAHFETLERDFGDRQISVKMGRVRIHRMVLYLLRTLGLTVTQQTRGMTTKLITFSPLCNMDTAPEPISGQEEHDIMTAWTSPDMSYTLIFESEPGMPCTVGGIFTGVEVNAL